LLYEKKYTIAGAKQYLKERQRDDGLAARNSKPFTIEQLREELIAIRNLLNK